MLCSYDGLIECADFNDGQQRFYQVPSLPDLFKRQICQARNHFGFLESKELLLIKKMRKDLRHFA